MRGTAPGDASAPTSLESELLTKQHTRGDYRTVEEQPRPALAASTAGREDFRELAAEPSRSRFHIATGILAAAPRVSECAPCGARHPSRAERSETQGRRARVPRIARLSGAGGRHLLPNFAGFRIGAVSAGGAFPAFMTTRYSWSVVAMNGEGGEAMMPSGSLAQ